MAKFIIEVCDEYIREHADLDRVKKQAEEGATGNEALSSMLTCMTFTELQRNIERGNSEFNISLEKTPQKAVNLYDHLVDMAASVYVIQE